MVPFLLFYFFVSHFGRKIKKHGKITPLFYENQARKHFCEFLFKTVLYSMKTLDNHLFQWRIGFFGQTFVNEIIHQRRKEFAQKNSKFSHIGKNNGAFFLFNPF